MLDLKLTVGFDPRHLEVGHQPEANRQHRNKVKEDSQYEDWNLGFVLHDLGFSKLNVVEEDHIDGHGQEITCSS